MPLAKAYDPSGVEDKRYAHWLEKGYIHGVVNSEKEPFSIVIPPPNVTGELHFGHALNNTLQDIMIRYKRMDGYEACWFPGTDHAGIATQNVVEKELKKEGLTRHDLGREAFIERVWAWKEKYGNRIRQQLQALGSSCDWKRERFTLDDGLSEAVKEVFIRLYEEGYIYRGERLINWCPRCQTAISDIEVDHEDEDSKLWHLRYPIDGSDESLVIATTRPETMLADTAVAVNPDDNRYKHLIGKQVRLPLMDRLIPVIGDEEVESEFGTGALKVTPAHDPTDFEIGERHSLERINIYHTDATLNEQAGKFEGLDRFAAREKVLEELESLELLVKEEEYTHSVGHCQRCKTVVEPLMSKQWFVKMTDLAKPAIEAVRSCKIEFVPERWTKTYYDWMENIRDWCISRQLWWGHRIPAWHCSDCGEIIVSRDTPDQCTACPSQNIHQEEDVLDTWFSSQLWPFSMMGWPEETPELKYFYPTSMLSTAPDIIFFWVARMIMMGIHFLGEIPFKRVLFHPTVKNEKGQRMSKSLGTGVDPLDMKEEFGMDSVRFTLASNMSKGQDLKLSIGDVEGSRKFLNKIWNATRFALMNLEDFSPNAVEFESLNLQMEDRWLLSKLNRTIGIVREALDNFDFNIASNTLYEFFWHDLCDWYLEMIKPRILDELETKREAQYVLHLGLMQSLKLLHPLIPFITDELWQKFPEIDAESLMISQFPTTNSVWNDAEAEITMRTLQELIGAIRTIRSELNVPPSKKTDVFILTSDERVTAICNEHLAFFESRARVEKLHVGADIEKPEGAPRKVFDFAEIFVPVEGLVDLEQLATSLKKELEAVNTEHDKVQKRLSDGEYLKKAPDHIIQRDRTKSEELSTKIEKLRENLDLLGVGS